MKKTKKTRVEEYRDEFSGWKDVLEKYFRRFNDNYKRYTNVNETIGTKAKISDPVAPELIERVIQKLFQRDPKFFAESRGKSLTREIKQVMSSAIEFLWSNPDMIQATGTMRSKLKVGGREFCVTGNMCTEVYWNHITDTPDMRVIPIEDVIFDPTKTLKSSPVYYVRQYVSLDYLKDNKEIRKDGKPVTGIFDAGAIKKLEIRLKDSTKRRDISRDINRSGGNYEEPEDMLLLISRYEGSKVCRFIWEDDEEEPLVVQEFDNAVLGTHPLQFAMDVEVPKEPYGFSILDYLGGLIKAKDMFLNQMVDYGSKVLNPPLFVDPSIAPVYLKTIANAWKLGGVVLAPPQQADHKPMPPLNNQPFDMLNYIEQRAESVTGIGAYLAGVPNQTSDKTQGTKGGIEALINQSVSPVQDRQINIEESIIEPAVNKWLKMTAATMGENEFKWVMITGEESKWIKVTRGLLMGKIKLVDLMTAGLVEDEEVQNLVYAMIENGEDPEKDILFDVDWMIKVETGSLAEVDSQKEIENKQMVISTGMQMGLPLDMEKLWKDLAVDAGVKEPEQYLRKDAGNPMEDMMAAQGQQPMPEGAEYGQPDMSSMPQPIQGQAI